MNRSLALAALALALAACSGSKDTDPPPPPPPPPPPVVVVQDFQAASTLLGQVDWGSTAAGACTAAAFTDPTGGVAWDGATLIVPDTFSGRLLTFNPLPGVENDGLAAPPATGVIGEPGGLNVVTCNDSTGTLYLPQAPSVSGGMLVVADSGFNQVRVWDALPSASNAAPSRVFGDEVGACSGTGLSDPRGAVLVGSTLVVADSAHNRVLVFDATDTSAPVLVLGQVESTSTDPFDYCAANDTDGDGIPGNTAPAGDAPSAATMSYPAAVWSDGTRLVVADTGNNRVLVWNTFPTVSGQAADAILGQTGPTLRTAGVGATGLSGPESVTSDGVAIFVADTGNNRIVFYPAFPTADGEAATIVLGQSGFTANRVAANDDDQDGISDATPSARTLSGPTGVAVVDDKLAITDTGNGRVVIHWPPAAP